MDETGKGAMRKDFRSKNKIRLEKFFLINYSFKLIIDDSVVQNLFFFLYFFIFTVSDFVGEVLGTK